MTLDVYCGRKTTKQQQQPFYSPREVTWQGGAIVMVQCIMK